jgi:hypothetical protein
MIFFHPSLACAPALATIKARAANALSKSLLMLVLPCSSRTAPQSQSSTARLKRFVTALAFADSSPEICSAAPNVAFDSGKGKDFLQSLFGIFKSLLFEMFKSSQQDAFSRMY